MYNYDAADRLTQFKRGTLNEGKTDVDTYTSDANLTQRQTWTLDDLGNWAVNELQQDSVSVAQAAAANLADEYTAIDFDGPGGNDPVEFAHDHNGNLKDDGTYLYDYDIENRMTRVRQKSGGATIAVYQYDALGRRIRKTIMNLGSGTDGTFEFVNSPEWQVLELNRTAGSAAFDVVAYVHAGQSAYIDDHVAYAVDTDPWTYYHADAQYNTLTTTNSTGEVGQRFLLDPYGRFVTYDATWTSISLAPQAGLLFVHQGLVLDGEAGKYQNRHREYRSTLGRFAQRDPVNNVTRKGELRPDRWRGGDSQRARVRPRGLHPVIAGTNSVSYREAVAEFEYVRSNPVAHRDPEGTTCGDGAPFMPGPCPQVHPSLNCQGCPPVAPGCGIGDGWCSEGTNPFHAGATECFRTYNAAGIGSGLQCCYNATGCLIPDNQNGTGSFDKWGPAQGENADGTCNNSIIGLGLHGAADVAPYLIGEYGEYAYLFFTCPWTK